MAQNSAVPPFGQWWGTQDCGQWWGLERAGGGGSGECFGGGGTGTLLHPWIGEGWDACAFRKTVSSWQEALRSGCWEFLSPWSLDSLTFPVSEEAVYSQKVIYSR